MAEEAGWFETKREGDTLLVEAGGAWTIPALARLDKLLRALAPDSCRDVVLDLSRVERLDTAGAWVLHRTLTQFAGHDIPARFAHVRPEHAALIAQAEHAAHAQAPPERSPLALIRFVMRIGEATIAICRNARNLFGFFGFLCTSIARSLLRPGRLRLVSIVSHMERTGVDAMPIVGLLSFLIGIVTVFQGIAQLRRFGAEILVINLLGISVLREMGILITAVIVAGRSGSSFTAEIGTMKVNEEIDAMRIIGLDPVEILVLPRMYALMFTMPLLAFFADIMGIAGGIAMSLIMLDASLSQILHQLRTAVSIDHFWVGMIKAPVFAHVIAMVGCFEGLNVARNAESIGRATTKSVVESIFLVIVLDAAFSVIFVNWGF